MSNNFDDPCLAERLDTGARRLGVALATGQIESLLRYAELLLRWNKVYNLTAVTAPDEVLTRHLLDSLAAHGFLSGKRIIDVGTGAGLPGIPLALAAPEREFVLLDSSLKRIRFVRQALAELVIGNAQAVQCRVEDYRPPVRFDTVIARAFAPLPRLLANVGHLSAVGGRILAMKGPRAREELADDRPAGWDITTDSVVVPGLAAERRMLVCTRRNTENTSA